MAWNRDRPSPRNATLPGDWRTRRARVMRRDAGRCYLCGADGADEVDHVTAVADGGTHDEDNLRAAHAACTRAKGSREARRWHPTTRWPLHRGPEEHPGIVE